MTLSQFIDVLRTYIAAYPEAADKQLVDCGDASRDEPDRITEDVLISQDGSGKYVAIHTDGRVIDEDCN